MENYKHGFKATTVIHRSMSDWQRVLEFLSDIPVTKDKACNITISAKQGLDWKVNVRLSKTNETHHARIRPGRGVGLHDLAW